MFEKSMSIHIRWRAMNRWLIKFIRLTSLWTRLHVVGPWIPLSTVLPDSMISGIFHWLIKDGGRKGRIPDVADGIWRVVRLFNRRQSHPSGRKRIWVPHFHDRFLHHSHHSTNLLDVQDDNVKSENPQPRSPVQVCSSLSITNLAILNIHEI